MPETWHFARETIFLKYTEYLWRQLPLPIPGFQYQVHSRSPHVRMKTFGLL